MPNFDDAMNLPKFVLIILFVLPASILFLNIQNLRTLPKAYGALPGTLALFLIASSLFSDNFKLSLIGSHARLNGLIFYLSLILFVLSILTSFDVFSFDRFFHVISWSLNFHLLYCTLQWLNLDLITWSSQYGKIVGTLGNPNFASIFISFSILINLYQILKSTGKLNRLLYGLFLILGIIVAIKTNSIQGPITALIGILLFVITQKKFESITIILAALTSLAFFVIGLAGLLNNGPLARLLYSESIVFRGDYWRAAYEMFRSNPIWGVGFGQYGYYFDQFRDVKQVLRRGANFYTDQPHNVFLDYLATGGIFSFVTYVTLVLTVLICGLKAINTSEDGSRRQLSSLLLSLFVIYLAQSLISIDQIALSFWGWAIGALVIVNYLNRPIKITFREFKVPSKVASLVFLVSTSILANNLVNADLAIKKVNLHIENGDLNRTKLIDLSKNLYKMNSIDPYYSQQSAFNLLKLGEGEEALRAFKVALAKDPQDAYSAALLASLYWKEGYCRKSLRYSEISVIRDPLNQIYLLDRLRCLDLQSDQAKHLYMKILEIDPSSMASRAAKDLYQ